VIALSTVEFEVCWDRLGLGALPPVLDLPSPGRTHDERRTVVTAAFDALRERDLADWHGPAPALAANLALLHRFTWAIDARVITTELVRARAAAAGDRGVLAVIDGDRVTLRELPAEQLITEVTALAGPAPRGPVESVSVRADAIDTAAALANDDPRALTEGLITLGERPEDARAVARICRGAHTRGRFTILSGGEPVAFHTTPDARYLHLRRDGQVTFTADPGPLFSARVRGALPGPRS
jgi:ESX secretion-associated protein EspG